MDIGQQLLASREDMQFKSEEMKRLGDEFFQSQALCGCSPLCAYHTQMYYKVQQAVAEAKLAAERLKQVAELAQQELRLRQDEHGYQASSQAQSRKQTGPKPCPQCNGKGTVLDHNPLGIQSQTKEKCSACDGRGLDRITYKRCSKCGGTGYTEGTRGWLDLLKNGGGNEKICPTCRGKKYV